MCDPADLPLDLSTAAVRRCQPRRPTARRVYTRDRAVSVDAAQPLLDLARALGRAAARDLWASTQTGTQTSLITGEAGHVIR
jgi:hypothetical protein